MNNKKITELNSYSTDHTLESIRSYKRKKTIRRRLTGIFIIGLSLIVLASIPVLKNINLANKFDAEASELTKQLETVEKEKEEIEYKIALLEDDEYIAKLARKELNLSKDNEILINLPEKEDSDLKQQNTSEEDEKAE